MPARGSRTECIADSLEVVKPQAVSIHDRSRTVRRTSPFYGANCGIRMPFLRKLRGRFASTHLLHCRCYLPHPEQLFQHVAALRERLDAVAAGLVADAGAAGHANGSLRRHLD